MGVQSLSFNVSKPSSSTNDWAKPMTSVDLKIAHFSSLGSRLDKTALNMLENQHLPANLNNIIIFQLESPHHFSEGCEYWVTLTVAYLFNDNGEYLGYSLGSPIHNYNCGQPATMFARELSISTTSDSRLRVNSLNFDLTGIAAIDSLLTDPTFKDEIKKLINDNIPSR